MDQLWQITRDQPPMLHRLWLQIIIMAIILVGQAYVERIVGKKPVINLE